MALFFPGPWLVRWNESDLYRGDRKNTQVLEPGPEPVPVHAQMDAIEALHPHGGRD